MNVTPAGGIFGRLDDEWAALCADTDVRASVYEWLMADHLAYDVAAATASWVRTLGPEQLLAALRPAGSATSDELADAVLRVLLKRAADRGRSATLAARIVVQAMLPATVRIARSQVRPFGGRTHDDVGHIVIAALYETARSGCIHHRRGRPAANVALDTLRRVCRELAADREELGQALTEAAEHLVPVPDSACLTTVRLAAATNGLHAAGDDEEITVARLQVLELVLDALENDVLSADEARWIAEHYSAGAPRDNDTARAAGVSAAAVRQRRSRAVSRLTASLHTTA
ncbi:hypothetical protein [Streptomyces sp. NPDC093097]|uniref:hypothetical protein n=1 Tax=Streptomyces sp. NPDC093097 TaxID=3366027 RepID=UPI00381B045B